jgi:uncharacterized protein (DUF2062 family)
MLKFFKQFFLINDTPHKIAAGAALGVFLGIAPGAGIAATLVLASVFKLNRLAAVAGAVATNTWTLVIALPMAAAVGGFLFGGNAASLIEHFNAIYDLGWRSLISKEMFLTIILPLAVGFIVVSGVIAVFFYIFTLVVITMHRKSLSR